MRKALQIAILFLLIFQSSFAGEPQGVTKHSNGPYKFIQNKGQWEEFILFKAAVPNGKLFLEENALTYHLINPKDLQRVHDHHHGADHPADENFNFQMHAFKVSMVGASMEKATGLNPTPDHVNYFLGNDRKRWASGVKKFHEVHYTNIYPNIDFRIYGTETNLKYDFVVKPGGSESSIELAYDGLDDIYLRKGQLHLETTISHIIEQKPYAYQIIDGVEKEVPCQFVLKNKVVHFKFPKSYDHSRELIIDPALIFSSYSGSPADNWGYTATYDESGHLYAGGIVINDPSNNYPYTVGAYDTTYNGGNATAFPGLPALPIDIVVTKFSPNGSTLIYSTYLGGNDNESPHSMVVNASNELLVLGTTGSSNFPTSNTAYDQSFNGGTATAADIISYNNGSDIIVAKFDSMGTSLLASTFVGGTGNDGLNLSGPLAYNYGDSFRGEIISDSNDNCYVATSTNSTDFPTSIGSAQNLYGGGSQDGCAFKLSPNLSTLSWSTFIGGTADDAAYSLQLDNGGEAFVAGGTNSSAGFPITAGVVQPNAPGGVDGFITQISTNGNNFVSSTYVGTPAYDQCYFVQLDLADDVYAVGQTEGSFPITPAGVYSVPNSGQFLVRYNNAMTSTVFSTEWGTGTGNIDLALSAFLVNNCNHIFISGWGGSTNVNNGGPPNSTTTGLPTTNGNGVFQTTTDGSDFYIMVLEDSATSLLFATFFGGNGVQEHVDGGTSRFDKKGIIYQAVCAGCGGSNSFPTTTGAWSGTNGSNNCNIGVIKYDLVTLEAEADVDGPTMVCVDDTVFFDNKSVGGSLFFWDFDDNNTTSTAFEPTHVYSTPGTYEVMLIIMDSVSCIETDTAYLTLTVTPAPVASAGPSVSICPGVSTPLSAAGGDVYEWIPATGLSDPNISNPVASPTATTTYKVYVSDSCGIDSAFVTVEVFANPTTIMPDTSVCDGQNLQLRAGGGIAYKWSPPFYLAGVNQPRPFSTPDSTITYTVLITDANSCQWEREMTVFVEGFLPQIDVFGDTTICLGDETMLSATGAFNYKWYPDQWINSTVVSQPTVSPETTTVYRVDTENPCGIASDSVLVVVDDVEAIVGNDQIVCPGDLVELQASGGSSYNWFGNNLVSVSNVPKPVALPTRLTEYTAIVTNDRGCTDTASMWVDVYPFAGVTIEGDRDTIWGLVEDPVYIKAIGEGSLSWTPTTGLDCSTCFEVTATPQQTTTYIATIKDTNGCIASDTVTVLITSTFYVPNTFTPGNGDDINNEFKAYGHKIHDFDMIIFDRWGHQIFHSKDIEKGWDGSYEKRPELAPVGIYVYKISYRVISGKKFEEVGRVNLIR